MLPSESHEIDHPVVRKHTAECIPGTVARASPAIPRLSAITEIEEESQTSGSMPDVPAVQHRDTSSD